MSKSEHVTLSEFAKVIGVSRQRVNYAANKGKIRFKRIKGVKMVNPKSAKKEWEADKDQTAAKKNPSGKKKKDDIRHDVPTFEGLTTSDAERQDKVFKARLSQLKYLEQSGQLVNVEKIKKEAFETGRKVRDAILSVPTRLAHELAAETDPHTLEVKLTKELNAALAKFIGSKK